MLTEGKYSKTQLFNELHITIYAWKYKQEELLKHLRKYFEFTIEDGKNNKVVFNITKVLQDDYEDFNSAKAKEKVAAYKEFCEEYVPTQEFNSITGIARHAVADERVSKYKHKVETGKTYVRGLIDEGFMKRDTSETVWVYRDGDDYIRLTQEQEDYLYNECFTEERKKKLIDYCCQLVDKEDEGDLQEIKGMIYIPYREAMDKFKAKYGYYCFKIGKIFLI